MPWYICVWVGENLDSVFLPVLAVGDIDAIIFVEGMGLVKSKLGNYL